MRGSKRSVPSWRLMFCSTVLTVGLAFSFYVGAHAQGGNTVNRPDAEVALGLGIGLRGLPGVDVFLKPFDDFGFRVGFYYMNYHFQGLETNFGKFSNDLSLDGSVNLNSLEITGEKGFWDNRIRAIFGLSFLYGNELSLKVKLADSTTINDLELSPDEIGYGYGNVKWERLVAPFFGFGIGKAIPDKKWNCSLDVGIYYKGSPSFRMDATNLVRSNTRNEELIEEKLQFLKWVPTFNFRVSKRIY